MAGRGSVGMEWDPENRPHPCLLESPQPSPQSGPSPRLSGCGRGSERGRRSRSRSPPPRPHHRAPGPSLAPPHSPGGGALAPALGGRAGAGRGDSSQRAAGAGSPAVSAGLRGREEARAGRTRWPGAAATTAAVVLGECSIHPSPTPGVSVGSQEAGSPPNPAAAAALRGRW